MYILCCPRAQPQFTFSKSLLYVFGTNFPKSTAAYARLLGVLSTSLKVPPVQLELWLKPVFQCFDRKGQDACPIRELVRFLRHRRRLTRSSLSASCNLSLSLPGEQCCLWRWLTFPSPLLVTTESRMWPAVRRNSCWDIAFYRHQWSPHAIGSLKPSRCTTPCGLPASVARILCTFTFAALSDIMSARRSQPLHVHWLCFHLRPYHRWVLRV